MIVEFSAALGFAGGGAASFVTTPLAITVARRTSFYDRPRGYRKHWAPTPFLGGAAVLLGFLVAAVAVGGASGRLLVLLGCAVGFWVLGTLDDRIAVAPKWRLLAEVSAAGGLTVAGLGWQTTAGDGVDAVLSVFWIVGLVNAFNLMDNLDGACATNACVSAVGIGTLAAIHGQPTLAGLAFGLAGACVGFLRWNLAGPAKIFLGDGGSMPVGFLVAALAMATARHMRVGDASLLAMALLAGLPILDTARVTFSRTRRRVPLTTGGRDHMTHRRAVCPGVQLRQRRQIVADLAVIRRTAFLVAAVGKDLPRERALQQPQAEVEHPRVRHGDPGKYESCRVL